jgi:ubiquinone/menaquinone biosynthesis C-methylase UbiE
MSEEQSEVRRFENDEAFYKWNEEMAYKYDPDAYHTRSNFLIKWIEKKRVKVILHYTSSNPQDKLLEVGCGAGNVLEQLGGESLTGIDLSRYLLQKSKAHLRQFKVNLVQADANRLPFPENIFDKLVCTEVLEHVQEPRAIILEMSRVATDNGILVISFPNESVINRLKQLIRILRLHKLLLQAKKVGDYSSPLQMTDEWHLHEFNLSKFTNWSKGVLKITHVKAIPFSIIPLRYVVRCHILNV